MYRAEMGRASGWEDGEGEGKGGGMSGSREQRAEYEETIRSIYVRHQCSCTSSLPTVRTRCRPGLIHAHKVWTCTGSGHGKKVETVVMSANA